MNVVCRIFWPNISQLKCSAGRGYVMEIKNKPLPCLAKITDNQARSQEVKTAPTQMWKIKYLLLCHFQAGAPTKPTLESLRGHGHTMSKSESKAKIMGYQRQNINRKGKKTTYFSIAMEHGKWLWRHCFQDFPG